MQRTDLEYIRQLNDLISGRCLRIAELKSKAYPGAIKYDDSGASRPMPENKLEVIFELVDAEERRVNKFIDKRYELKRRALMEIKASGLSAAEKHILYLRYLATDPQTCENLTWSMIYDYVNKYHNITMRRMYQLHHHALRVIERYNM